MKKIIIKVPVSYYVITLLIFYKEVITIILGISSVLQLNNLLMLV